MQNVTDRRHSWLYMNAEFFFFFSQKSDQTRICPADGTVAPVLEQWGLCFFFFFISEGCRKAGEEEAERVEGSGGGGGGGQRRRKVLGLSHFLILIVSWFTRLPVCLI